ncbi:MAG: hypothetical protein DRG20_00930 [Deltaproteobacteria bacterium]|nr:MAG: hypothetical protein DRG20_00930 [Deltaproteobacteria bacterium]
MLWEIAEVNKGVVPPNEKSPWNLLPGEWQKGENIVFTLSGVEKFYGFTKLWSNYQFPQRILWITNIGSYIIFLGRTKIFHSFNGDVPEETKYKQKLGESNGGNTYNFSSYIYKLDKGTVKIQYTRGGTTYQAWDVNSDGNLYEDGNTSYGVGTVNYDTGEFNLDFSTVGAPDNGTDILLIETKFTLSDPVDNWKEFTTPNFLGFCSVIYKPLKWNEGEAILEPIADAPKARVMWYQDRHLLAAGGGQGENKISWSDLDNPEDWSSGEAGYGFVDLDVSDVFQFVANIGGQTFLFANRSIWSVEYIGYPGYWRVKPAMKEMGALSPNAYAEFGDEALVFMNDGAYNSTGPGITPITNGLLRTLYETINPNKLNLFFSIFDEYTKHVLFFYTQESKSLNIWQANTSYSVGDEIKATSNKDKGFYFRCTQAGTSGSTEPDWPLPGNTVTDGTVIWECVGTYDYCEKALLHNYDINTWNTLNIGKIQAAGFWRESGEQYIDNVDIIIDECNTLIDAVTYSSNFPILIFILDDGYCYKLDYNKVVNNCEFITGYIPLEEYKIAQKRKLLTEIELKGEGKIKCKVGFIKNINSSIIWSNTYEYTFGEKEQIELAADKVEGKYFILKFFSDTPDSFKITGIVIHFAYQGEE